MASLQKKRELKAAGMPWLSCISGLGSLGLDPCLMPVQRYASCGCPHGSAR